MKNNIAIVLSIIATGTGGFGAYTAWHANKAKQPLDKHQQVAMSFKDQITSAANRGDVTNANVVRVMYEQYEESWRENQLLERITASIRSLDLDDISEAKRAEISVVLNKVTKTNKGSIPSAEVLGAAYFAIRDYKKASEQFGVALASNPSDNNLRVLKAASLVSTQDSSDQDLESFKIQAIELVDENKINFSEKQKYFLFNTNDESIRMVLDR